MKPQSPSTHLIEDNLSDISEAGYSNGYQNGGQQQRYQRAQGGITCQVMDR